MAYRLLANSCDNGPCPTIYIDDATGDVLVQGYRTWSKRPTGKRIPIREDVVRIDAAAWERLRSQIT